MATKGTKKPKPIKQPPRGTPADKGIEQRLDETDKSVPFNPNSTQRKVASYVKRRINEMQVFRQQLNIEGRWREADQEYVPHELDFGTTRKRFETDQDTGLRSRMVPVGDITQQWRQSSSAPTLLAKIQTAISIIIDQQPEAELVALERKYMATTDLAYALWKRNWSITDAKEKLKIYVFNLIKYGWAPQRTYPRKVVFPKRVLVEVDPENPENNKYEDKEVEWFNDVDRQPTDPFRTWIDELSMPYDPLSTNESYFELDYSYDQFMTEFGIYPESKTVPRNSQMTRPQEESKTRIGGTIRAETKSDPKDRQDIVTVGFFESRLKDLFVIYIPKWNIPIYLGPQPNDEGYLSVSHSLYILRSAKLPYGISLWEIIRQNKALYDKMKNMTMDQLVLSIMKFGFYSGTNPNLGDGKIEIIPGQARQLTSSTGKPEINWMEIPGPGDEAWKGLEAVADMMDDESGISPTLEGDITGKTLGEILHAKEASLKRLKIPVENIAWAIEQDAYISLSWMSQLYSIPVVQEFANEAEMQAFEKENEMTHDQLFAKNDENGTQVGIKATYLPQLALHLEDREGKLIQGKQSKFFQVGTGQGHIQPRQLRWKGIFKVLPRSIIDSSETLVKASKMEVFNIIMPLIGSPLPNAMQIYAKPVAQILKINEEDEEDWLPDSWIQYLQTGQVPMPPAPPAAPAPADQGPPPFVMPGGADQNAPPSISPSNPAQTIQAQMGQAPQTPQTVVPTGQVTPAGPPMNAGGLFKRRL